MYCVNLILYKHYGTLFGMFKFGVNGVHGVDVSEWITVMLDYILGKSKECIVIYTVKIIN